MSRLSGLQVRLPIAILKQNSPPLFNSSPSAHPSTHPSASVYSHTKIKPAKQIRNVFVHTIMICGSIFPFNFLECIHRILLSSQIFFFCSQCSVFPFCFANQPFSLLLLILYSLSTAPPYQILYIFFNTLCLLLILLLTIQPYLATLGIVTFILLQT